MAAYSGRVFARMVLLLVSVLTLLSPAVAAQDKLRSDYVSVLEQYQLGDDSVVRWLARLEAPMLEGKERALVKAMEQMEDPASRVRLLRAAILAHTDAAILARNGLAISWTPHLSAAQRYVERLAAMNRDDPVALRWWIVVIGAMHAQRNYAQAISAAARARQVCGERVEYVLAAGVTNELAWAWQHEEGFPSPFHGSLDDAEKSYERALAMDATLVEARVRLGRVRLLKGSYDGALRTLEEVPASAGDALQYLAWLFAGDALEHLGKVTEARTRYEAAARLLPHAQSAQMALAYNQYAGGARTEADGRVREFATDRRGRDDSDPWFSYLLGLGAFAQPQLDKLRAVVRQ